MDINVIIASTVGLFVITLLLVTMLLFAKARLLPSGPVKLIINGEKNVEVNSGDTLLTTLGNNKIFLPSACGGGGTCVADTAQSFAASSFNISFETDPGTTETVGETDKLFLGDVGYEYLDNPDRWTATHR